MASKAKFIFLVLLIAVLCLVMTSEDPSDWNTSLVSFPTKEFHNRKVLRSMREMLEAGSNSDEKKVKVEVEGELRKVPSGPNPLHHHGNSPAKPQTP